jgi:hypothetical protein
MCGHGAVEEWRELQEKKGNIKKRREVTALDYGLRMMDCQFPAAQAMMRLAFCGLAKSPTLLAGSRERWLALYPTEEVKEDCFE